MGWAGYEEWILQNEEMSFLQGLSGVVKVENVG
jgi:hypothetical protein